MSSTGKATNGVVLAVRVVPRASRDELCGLYGDAVKIRLQAPPVEGKANKALTRFLAKELGVSQSAVRIRTGESARTKRVEIAGITPADVERWVGGTEKTTDHG